MPFFVIMIFVSEKKKNNSDAILIPKNSPKTPEISTASGGTYSIQRIWTIGRWIGGGEVECTRAKGEESESLSQQKAAGTSLLRRLVAHKPTKAGPHWAGPIVYVGW